jgi:hypothetical protein
MALSEDLTRRKMTPERVKEHLKTYKALSSVPETSLKKIEGGRLKNKSDITPQWRYKVMTETFGLCGFGWKYEVTKQWTEKGSFDQIMCFVNIDLYVKIEEEWSTPIPANGGNMLVTKESTGLHTSDEGFKMATTDALGTAMKMLGVAADVYMGEGGKYADKERQELFDQEKDGPTKAQTKEIERLMAQKQVSEKTLCDHFGISEMSIMDTKMAGKAIQFMSLIKIKDEKKYMCPNTDKMVTDTDCNECDNRKGCPEHEEDVPM